MNYLKIPILTLCLALTGCASIDLPEPSKNYALKPMYLSGLAAGTNGRIVYYTKQPINGKYAIIDAQVAAEKEAEDQRLDEWHAQMTADNNAERSRLNRQQKCELIGAMELANATDELELAYASPLPEVSTKARSKLVEVRKSAMVKFNNCMRK
ncbi:hypothetical protein fHeYen901_46 [Yersinia phage fHe-Yen9-01]|uniref:Lipoprotein n=1 Tax=Yersinia phage fHe-Yen9-01 TaxID=1965363 RepID=A0A1V0DXE8_9CAUD|nr:hypothetical protein KNT60_gp045 [Yersinia phage fHe-Yen9-01]ARB05819.1 hypothetical protein fHeYen901_46 [Yersinia phage fHe-Yen9-01]